jgi:hypothetical protein
MIQIDLNEEEQFYLDDVFDDAQAMMEEKLKKQIASLRRTCLLKYAAKFRAEGISIPASDADFIAMIRAIPGYKTAREKYLEKINAQPE